MAGQLAQRVFIKDLRDEAHITVELYLFPIRSGDTGAFLSAVLESKECKKGKPSYILTRTVYTENPAFFV
jgi:hypothetical protein